MTEETLDALLTQMAELVQERHRIITEARERINEANRTFDRLAVPLRRRIDALMPEHEPVVKAAPPLKKHPKKFNLDGTDGMSQEDIDHFRELAGRRKK